MYRLAHEKKMMGLYTPNLDFNPLPTRFNFIQFLHAFRKYAAHQRRREQVYKHGINIVLKLVSIEYQKRDAFWQLCS